MGWTFLKLVQKERCPSLLPDQPRPPAGSHLCAAQNFLPPPGSVTLFVSPFMGRVRQDPVGCQGAHLGLCLDGTSSDLDIQLDKDALWASPPCPPHLQKSTRWDQTELDFSRKKSCGDGGWGVYLSCPPVEGGRASSPGSTSGGYQRGPIYEHP